MISNYKYFSEFLRLQPYSLCAMEGRLCSLIMTLYMTKCKRLHELQPNTSTGIIMLGPDSKELITVSFLKSVLSNTVT